MESFIDATPIVLGYLQHLVLKLELLEAALSASKGQDRKRILNSTKVLEIAHKLCRSRIWGNCKFSYKSVVPFRNANILASMIDSKGDGYMMLKLFAKIAKVARYDPCQWEKVMKMLKSRPSHGDTYIVELCREKVMTAIPEEAKNIEMLPWEDYDSDDECAREATMESHSEIGRLMPNATNKIPEASEGLSMDKVVHSQTPSNVVEHAEELLDRPREIVKLMRRYDGRYNALKSRLVFSIKQLFECMREREGQVMELIREWSDDDDNTRCHLVLSTYEAIKNTPERIKEAIEIFWTLCEDHSEDVCKKAREELTRDVWFDQKRGGFASDAILMLTEREPHSCRSSFVRLVAIVYNLREATHDDLHDLFSNLSQEYITPLYKAAIYSYGISRNDMAWGVVGVHLIHLMCLKAMKPPEVEESELLKTIDEANAFPNKVVLMSIKLLSIPSCPNRINAPLYLKRLAFQSPEYKEEIFNILEELTEKYNDEVAIKACFFSIPFWEEKPQRAERIASRFEELTWLKLADRYLSSVSYMVSLDELLRAYMACCSDFLIPFIVGWFFETPVTMETMSNGSNRLIVQTASGNKKTYDFKTIGDAEVFRSIVEKCTERRFQEVASLMWSRVSKRQNDADNETLSSRKTMRRT